MATWKRLTNVNGSTIHVNLDAVMYMQRDKSPVDPKGHTVLMFPARDSEVWVKETPDQICALPEAMCPPLPAPGISAAVDIDGPARRVKIDHRDK
jgi:hypothetical protein